jgi:hypothetical protein
MSETIIRGAKIIAIDTLHGTDSFESDILIEGGLIKAIGPDLFAWVGQFTYPFE